MQLKQIHDVELHVIIAVPGFDETVMLSLSYLSFNSSIIMNKRLFEG